MISCAYGLPTLAALDWLRGEGLLEQLRTDEEEFLVDMSEGLKVEQLARTRYLLWIDHVDQILPAQAQTLDATALVHEAYLKLIGRQTAKFEDRAHFFAYAASAMRSVVVDYARQRLAVKRGGDLHRVTDLPEDVGGGMRINDELLGLDVALTRLADVDAKLAQVVELRYFAGLSEAEIATLLKRSERSVRRDWQKARLYLLASLQD